MEGEYRSGHVSEKDQVGGMVKATNVVVSTGTHSLLGEVTGFTTVHIDRPNENEIDFIETDNEGNSIFVHAVGRDGGGDNKWGADGIITGGTGKYLGATGTYTAAGQDADGKTKWTAKGVIYLNK